VSKDKDPLVDLCRSLGVPPRVFAGAPAEGLASTEFKKAWDEYDQQIIWSWQLALMRPVLHNMGFAVIEGETAQRLHAMFEACPVCGGDIRHVANLVSCTKCRLFSLSFSGVLTILQGKLEIGFVVVNDFFDEWVRKIFPSRKFGKGQEDSKQRALAALEETIRLTEDKRPEPTAFLIKYNTHDYFGPADALVFADWCDENGYPLNAIALRERYPQ
jgi:hypothetical protein